jgi:cell division protease FtsH
MQDKTSQDTGRNRDQRQRQIGFNIGYVIVALLLLWLFQDFVLAPLVVQATEIPYSTFKQKLAAGQIVDATISDSSITGDMQNLQPNATAQPNAIAQPNANPQTLPFITFFAPDEDPDLVIQLQQAGVTYSFAPPPSSLGGFLLAWVLPLGLLAGFWYLSYRQVGARGAGSIFGVGRSKATVVQPETVGITFKDVGGADEPIAELREIIEFLPTPEQFARLGGHVPKGVLLVGPPGTGKTLLAKATAGEAGVPFFETSGAEFVEMFVGVGAARVRDLFEQARKAAPAIVFIDEIDAIGGSRADGTVRFGVNDEREQTLNQLLAEIDGFKSSISAPVIIMAATNRPEVLDPALLRAGRFDRQITVGNPDLTGRIQILRIHSRDLKLAPDFDLEPAARMTPGFSGADLENVMNEAALHAARRNADVISLADFEAAIERVVAGFEPRTHVMNSQVRATVAYHESGHALLAALLPHADPVGKISIIPHSRGALGYTIQTPSEDTYLLTSAELEDRLATLLGGRAAERVVFGRLSTGASDDIAKATELARRMVTEFGMSPQLGSVRYAGQSL